MSNLFSQPEICVISDLHFGVHQNSPLWHDTAIKFIKWLINELKQRGVKDILIAGDVFHNRNDIAVNTLNTVADIFNMLAEFNIIILVGNHDAFYKDRSDVNSISILSGWKNIKVYTEPTQLTYMGKMISICPWGSTLDQIPEGDVVFGHFEIVNFKMNNFKVCEHGFTSDELFSKTDLVISGHFHLREERNYKHGTILYLGSPYELDWGDKETVKGICLLDFATLNRTFIPNTISPKHIEIKLTDLIKNGMAGVKEKMEGNIVRFVVDKEIDTDKVDILAKKLNTFQPLSFSIEYFCFTAVDNSDLVQVSDGVNIEQTIDDFIKTMDIKNREKVSAYVLELYKKIKQ